ncbi:hypothetical protein DSO57_1000736 [Entomophthora muscae]|uniref:Uncharacterized protein n=1 Tax=Entomophthora muscae TaxID=34485 RepID=A0ACC2T915_9FUNG|nr:hypothetical protein DSO57_1000736 [Entomophthora muscae]
MVLKSKTAPILEKAPASGNLHHYLYQGELNPQTKIQGEVTKGLIPKEEVGYQLSPEEKQHQAQLGLCMYCGKSRHSAKYCQALAMENFISSTLV